MWKDEDPGEDPPAYMSTKAKPKYRRDSPPSYQEAVGDDSTEEEYQSEKKHPHTKSDIHQPRKKDRKHPPCSHWSESRCQMTTNSRQCCSCVDQRPETESGLYSVYTAREGLVERAARWQFYCPSCREYFDPNAKAKLLRDQCDWAEKRAQSLAEERDRRYFGLGRWLHVCGEAVKGCLPD